MKHKTFKEFLNEAPYLYDRRKELEHMASLSIKSMSEGFNLLGSIDENFDVYENKETGAILAGKLTEEGFFIFVRITCAERNLYVRSMQLGEKRKHIMMVNVQKEFARQDLTTETYHFVAKRFDLISDRVQYIGAKDLWLSIVRQGIINVYVFDEAKKDYIRDENGKAIKYNGKNINETEIWGKEQKHHGKLLVATIKELK